MWHASIRASSPGSSMSPTTMRCCSPCTTRREIDAELTAQSEVHAHFVSSARIDKLVDTLRGHNERFLFLTTLGAVKDASGRTLTLNETISAICAAGQF